MLRCLLLLLGLLAPAGAATAQTAGPPDTIPGHGPLVCLLADSLCRRLARQRQQVDFRQLPARQGTRLLAALTRQLARENRPAIENILLAVRPERQNRYRRQLSRDLVLRLATSCPTAHQVIADLNYQYLHDQSPLPPAEQAALVPVALRINQVLTEADRRDPLEDRPRAEEKQFIRATFHACLLEAAPDLTAYYGPDALGSPAALAHVTERLLFVLLNNCPQYVLMLTMQ